MNKTNHSHFIVLLTWYQSDKIIFFSCFFTMSGDNTDTAIPPSSFPQSSNPIKQDPHAIRHSNSPSIVLVAPLLTGNNYESWSRAVKMALCAKSKLGFVDGSLPIPNKQNDISNWERCNDLVGSWIPNSVSHDFVQVSCMLKLQHKFGLISRIVFPNQMLLKSIN